MTSIRPAMPGNLLSLKLITKMVCILVAHLLFALPARAWNSLGHRTVAELAWRAGASPTR